MRRTALLALLAGVVSPLSFATGFLEGRGVEQSVEHSGPIQRVVVEGRYLDVDIAGAAIDGVVARAVVSSKFQRRNDFELQIVAADGQASIGFAVNERPISGYSIAWGPRLTVAVPRAAEVYIRTTTGDVLVTGIGAATGHPAPPPAVVVETVASMVVIQDCAADVRVVNAAGEVVVRRVAGDLHLASDSGDLTVTDSAGDVRASTASGRQRFTNVDGVVTVASRERTTVSGRVRELRIEATGLPELPQWGAETPWRRR